LTIIAAKRPIADVLIGAYAMRRSGLITRNANDFTMWFDKLAIVDPTRTTRSPRRN